MVAQTACQMKHVSANVENGANYLNCNPNQPFENSKYRINSYPIYLYMQILNKVKQLIMQKKRRTTL